MNQPTNGPSVSASTLPVRTNPPAVVPTAPLPAAPTAAGAATVTPRRRGPGRSKPAAAAPAVAPSTEPVFTQEHLLDLGRLHVLAAKAGMEPKEFAEDCRLIVVAWDRFQASLGK